MSSAGATDDDHDNDDDDDDDDPRCALSTFSLSGDVPDFEFARGLLSAVQIWTRPSSALSQQQQLLVAMVVVVGPVVAVLGARRKPEGGDDNNDAAAAAAAAAAASACPARFAILSIPPDIVLAQSSAAALNARLLESDVDIHRACQCLMDLAGSDNAMLRYVCFVFFLSLLLWLWENEKGNQTIQ